MKKEEGTGAHNGISYIMKHSTWRKRKNALDILSPFVLHTSAKHTDNYPLSECRSPKFEAISYLSSTANAHKKANAEQLKMGVALNLIIVILFRCDRHAINANGSIYGGLE